MVCPNPADPEASRNRKNDPFEQLTFPKHTADVPPHEEIKRAIEKIHEKLHPAPITTYIKKGSHKNQRSVSNQSELVSALQDAPFNQTEDSITNNPVMLIINFLKDKRFDYREAAWNHVAYTNDGVCEMTIKYCIYFTSDLCLLAASAINKMSQLP